MKIVGLIPFRFNGNGSRETIKLAGKNLIDYSVNVLHHSALIDEIIIYSSNDKILNYIDRKANVKYIRRPEYLDCDNVSIEDIIECFIDSYQADMIVLLQPFCPFLKTSTLDDCVSMVLNNNYDSAYTALEIQKFTWFNEKPLNFNKNKKTPKTTLLDKIIVEQGLAYILSKNAFLNNRSRIGSKPYIKIINHLEGHEVNNSDDLEVANLIVNSGVFQGF